jgi:hypothetical protein
LLPSSGKKYYKNKVNTKKSRLNLKNYFSFVGFVSLNLKGSNGVKTEAQIFGL